jgi:hypothetical protein
MGYIDIEKREEMKKYLKSGSFIGILMLLLTGCMTNENISKDFTASSIGCNPSNIQILNEKASLNGMHTWTAMCKGKEYFCTYHVGDGSKCSEIK